VALPPTPAGLLARTAAAAEAGPGHIEVVRVAKDGRTSWIVALPGTQASGTAVATANPFDETGVAEALASDSRFVAEAVSRALDAAGAAAGEQVVLVGYSQGGIHAMNLARNPGFLARHPVDYVLTAGSPVGDRPAAAGVKSLHLEHRQDWVPGADGLPNPDGRNQVTVTFAGHVETPDGVEPGLGPGHNFGNYLAAARSLEHTTDVSVADSAAALSTALAGGTARRQLFVLAREPLTGPAAGLQGGPGRRDPAVRPSGGAGGRPR
jgi:pimeloyl-ACP methyl ester carboxylesterase